MEEGLATNRREAGLNLNLAKQKRSFHAQVGHWAADIFHKSRVCVSVDCEMDATVQRGPCQCVGGTEVMEVTKNWRIVRNASNGGAGCEHTEGRAISWQECQKRSNHACPGSSEGAVGFLLALALFAGLLLAAWFHSSQRENFSSNVVGGAPQSLLGNHIVLEKDGELKRNAGNLIKRERQLEEEFLWLEAFDKETIKQTKLKTVSVREENRLHNRYIDIGNLSDISQL